MKTVIGGEHYLNYAPIYLYSLKKYYPDVDVKIYSWDAIPANVAEALEFIECEDCVEVKDYSDYPDTPNHIAASRWILGRDEFAGYRYGYIGDVDMIFMPPPPEILKYNQVHIDQIRACYSNKKRCHAIADRLTGLHFFEVVKYFDAVEDKVEEYLEKIKDAEYNWSNATPQTDPPCDEELLYRIVKESGLAILDNCDPWFRRCFGLHLEIARIENPREKRKALLANEETLNAVIAFNELYSTDATFQELLGMLSVDMQNEIDGLYEFINGQDDIT